MKFVRTLSPLFMMLALATASAVAQTAIYSPANGSQVGSPFTLNMAASSCSGQAVSAVGYSLDNSTQAAIFQVNYMNGPVSTSAGWHVLHVKVWNRYGAFCPTDLSIDVVPGASATGSSNATSVIPANAIGVGGIQTMWAAGR